MKKIINGRRYDTDTAQRIAEWDNGLPGGDLDYISESLYQKRTGEFFLHGDGGARSWAAVPDYDAMAPGERIRPLSEEEAREWCENRLDADDYEAIWGESEEVSVADVIRELRAKTGRTQIEFAEWCGIPFSTINKWECSAAVPPAWAVKLLTFYVDHADRNDK